MALTANALEGDRERCLAAGMNDYIAKPIDPAQMFPTLIRYLPESSAATLSPAALVQAHASRNGRDDAILEALAQVPGIDVASAVSRMMGRRDLYARLACRMAELEQRLTCKLADHEQAITELLAAIRQLMHPPEPRNAPSDS